ncbi:MAG: sulfatase-like hydrolase/transferase [Planctomycetales bacterium]|nr:sulfatase-like hydrolase/transferase [Planctomycetales bacterium]
MKLLCRMLACLMVCATEARAADAPRPNIIVFLADDLGSADVPWRGGNYTMPVLDALAKQSVRLETHYVHPMCSPTRAALLSGRYASRFGCTGAQNEQVFPFGTTTLASALQSAGYHTALIGKWHLGSLPEQGPNKFGFDESYGSLAGGVGPYEHKYKTGPFQITWHRNGELKNEEGHVTDLIAREAVAFVGRQSAEKPFFLYVPFTAVHLPITEPKEWLDRNAHIADEGQRLHAACATHMDDAIGQVLAALDKQKLTEDTLVLFFSDNGGHGLQKNIDPKYVGDYPDVRYSGHNTPLRGFKGQVYDGGIRSAAIVRWPKQLPAGAKLEQMTHAVDWFPTFARLAGYEPTANLKWDGHDLSALLQDPTTTASAALSVRSIYCPGVGFRGGAFRQGPWKLIVDRDGKTELYNLADAPGESRNLADAEPSHVARLRELMKAAAANDRDSVAERKPRKAPEGDAAGN